MHAVSVVGLTETSLALLVTPVLFMLYKVRMSAINKCFRSRFENHLFSMMTMHFKVLPKGVLKGLHSKNWSHKLNQTKTIWFNVKVDR